MAEIILLGPQRRIPTFHSVLKALGVEGPVCVVTAGWQEREGEVEEIKGYANREIIDLMLYHRSEDVFQRDPELFEAHRQRQVRLQELQRYYRLRLSYALEATRELLREEGKSPLLASERRAAIAVVRGVDRHHLRQIRQIHAEFQQTWRPIERPAVSVERRQLAGLLQESCALLVAGRTRCESAQPAAFVRSRQPAGGPAHYCMVGGCHGFFRENRAVPRSSSTRSRRRRGARRRSGCVPACPALAACPPSPGP